MPAQLPAQREPGYAVSIDHRSKIGACQPPETVITRGFRRGNPSAIELSLFFMPRRTAKSCDIFDSCKIIGGIGQKWPLAKPMAGRVFLKAYLIAGIALAAALAVYLFARSQPPLFFPRFDWIHTVFAVDAGIFGSAPSLFYTLALGLLIGLATPSAKAAGRNCLLWTGLALVLELSQLSTSSRILVEWLLTMLPARAWDLVGPYWISGVFDPFDLLATLAGGLFAWSILGRFSRGNRHETHA